MIRKTIFCVCLIMLLARYGYGKDVQYLNGNDWQEWDKNAKLIFISGFLTGSGFVVDGNMDDLYQLHNKLTTTEGGKVEEIDQVLAAHEKIRNRTLKRYSLINITSGQIVDGIDILYKDFKNTGIKISDAIYVVKRQIEGTSPEDIEKILIYLRSNHKNHFHEPLVTRDKNGGVINSIEFP